MKNFKPFYFVFAGLLFAAIACSTTRALGWDQYTALPNATGGDAAAQLDLCACYALGESVPENERMKDCEAAEKDPSKTPPTTEGLKMYFQTMLDKAKNGNMKEAEAMARELVIPNHEAWFKKVFGEKAGSRLALDYDKNCKKYYGDFHVEQFLQTLVERSEKGIEVVALISPGPKATGSQNQVMRAMKKPVPLYSVRVGGLHLWSFVYVDGKFRHAGKMHRSLPSNDTEFESKPDPKESEEEEAALRREKEAITQYKKDCEAAEKDPSKTPPTNDGLKKYFQTMLDKAENGNMKEAKAMMQEFIVQNHEAWFKKVFGEKVGSRMASDYSENFRKYYEGDNLDELLQEMIKRSKEGIKVTAFVSPGHGGTGGQNQVMRAMKKPVALYSVRMGGTHYWSFVYVDGKFRHAGKMYHSLLSDKPAKKKPPVDVREPRTMETESKTE